MIYAQYKIVICAYAIKQVILLAEKEIKQKFSQISQMKC